MSRGPDAATQLERALARMATAAGVALSVSAIESIRWASATFTGSRHRITLRAPRTAAFDRWLSALPEAEFRLRAQIVADLVVARCGTAGNWTEAEVEALTVETD